MSEVQNKVLTILYESDKEVTYQELTELCREDSRLREICNWQWQESLSEPQWYSFEISQTLWNLLGLGFAEEIVGSGSTRYRLSKEGAIIADHVRRQISTKDDT